MKILNFIFILFFFKMYKNNEFMGDFFFSGWGGFEWGNLIDDDWLLMIIFGFLKFIAVVLCSIS